MCFYTIFSSDFSRKIVEGERKVNKQRERVIDNLVGRGKIDNAYITNKKKGSSVDLSVQTDYIQVAYQKDKTTEFKKIDCSALL